VYVAIDSYVYGSPLNTIKGVYMYMCMVHAKTIRRYHCVTELLFYVLPDPCFNIKNKICIIRGLNIRLYTISSKFMLWSIYCKHGDRVVYHLQDTQKLYQVTFNPYNNFFFYLKRQNILVLSNTIFLPRWQARRKTLRVLPLFISSRFVQQFVCISSGVGPWVRKD
jgi:hypothetical protein